PLIVFALLAMLAHVSVAPVGGFALTAAEVLLAAVTIYYLTLDSALALLMLLVSAAFVAAGRHVPVLTAAGLFVLGWILQFVGHYVYEKKSPAFFQNLTHLLVGPLWILAKAIGRA
ncbi:MAG TPA: Mpo1-like protein, partial [Vicinamibacteria bacterium]|nr:Mpo1-like protein [Vicinamibacteria bacterium]